MTTVLEDNPQAASQTIHVVVADDRPLRRSVLRQTLAAALGDIAVGEAGDLATLIAALAGDGPVDLVLLDLAMPGIGGLSGLLYLRSQHPDVPVIVVSASEDRTVMRRCIDLGAAGFIPESTSADVMGGAIRMVLDGEIWTPDELDAPRPDATVADTMKRLFSLTPQQLRVLMLLSQGLLNKQIAYELKVSEATVKAHVSAVLQKLDVENRTQAVLFASRIDRGQFKRERLASAH